MRFELIFLTAAVFLTSSCRKEDGAIPPPTGAGGQGGQSCNASHAPVVMCHGMLASGDTWTSQIKRFVQNGYCADRLFVHDRNTLGGGSAVPLLDAFIDQVLLQTGAERVELVGHSAGGGLGYEYLADPVRAAKIAHYVHIGSSPQSGPAGAGGEVPTMNIWSPDDAIATGADIVGATNVILAGKDHYEVATSGETFAAMYQFFRASAPTSTTIVADGARAVSGRVVTFGENQPIAGAPVKVFAVDPATGARLSVDPVHTYVSDASGHWGGFAAGIGGHYEFEVSPPGGRRIHYYREPFLTSDRTVYLRVMPPPSSLAGILLASLPADDQQAVITVFSSSQAVITDRDALEANAVPLATPEFAAPSNCTIAYFLYDDGDGVSSGNAVGLYGSFPFLSGVDVFFPAGGASEVLFNGRSLFVHNWPSSTEGIVVAVFD